MGCRSFQRVEEFTALGDHRSGTTVEQAAAQWEGWIRNSSVDVSSFDPQSGGFPELDHVKDPALQCR